MSNQVKLSEMTRLQKMELLKTHPILKMLFKRLTKEELASVEKFIQENEHLNRNDYAHKVNRWMIDQPKPKHYSDMWAIASQSI